MKKSLASLVILLIFYHQSNGCSCSPQSGYEVNVQKAYEESELVVLGTLLREKGKDSFTIQVIEYLKGHDEDILTLELTNSCSFNLEINDLWLLYLTKNEGKLTTYQCFPNRLFPKMNKLSFPPPPNDSGRMEESYLRSVLLYQELISLRQNKLLNDTTGVSAKSQPREKGSWMIVTVLCINTLLLLILLFKNKR